MGCKYSTLATNSPSSSTVTPLDTSTASTITDTSSSSTTTNTLSRPKSVYQLQPSSSSVPETETKQVKSMLVNAWADDAGNALRLLLKNSNKTRKYFEIFLKHEFSNEHYEFILAVDKLTKLQAKDDHKTAWDYAKLIFDKYIKPGAISEVNLSAKIRDGDFNEANYTEYLANAQDEIFRMLSLDAFPRFLQSKNCDAMLEELALVAAGRTKGNNGNTDANLSEGENGSSLVYSPIKVTEHEKSLISNNINEGDTQTPVVPVSSESESVPTNSSNLDALSPADQELLVQSIQKARNTARKSAGIWLEAFKAVANLLPSSIVIADMSVKGVPLIYINKEFSRISGYAPEEIYGKNCRFLQGPETDQATVQLLRDAIREHKEVSCEILNYRKNCEKFRNYLTLRPVFWPENTPLVSAAGSSSFFSGCAYFIGVQYEITEDNLMVQRLLHHEAILKMLPGQVSL